MLEIKFSGRGGQGVVLTSQILGLAFFKAGLYPQCYSVFGGERRGAPVVGFLRVDPRKILLKCEIRHPHELVCLDEGLFDPTEVQALLRPGGRILLNSGRSPEAFGDLSPFRLGLIDGVAISQAVGLGRMVNTAVLGAYCRFTGHLTLEALLEAVAEMVPAKTEANLEAARRAFESFRRVEPESCHG